MRATWCSALSIARSSAVSGSAAVGVRLHEASLQVNGDLAELTRVDARRVHFGEVDFDAPGVVGETGDLADLLAGDGLRVGPAPCGSCLEPRCPFAPRICIRTCDVSRRIRGDPGGGVRAPVTASTCCAPAARSAAAAAASVAPVVATSSTSSTRDGAARRAAKCGPTRRAAAASPVCGGPGRRSRSLVHGTPQPACDGPRRGSPPGRSRARGGAAAWWAPS